MKLRILMVAYVALGVAQAQVPDPVSWLAPSSGVPGHSSWIMNDLCVADVRGDARMELLSLAQGVTRIFDPRRPGVVPPVELPAVPGMRVITALDIDLDGDTDVLLAGDGRVVALLQGPEWVAQQLFEGGESVGSRRLSLGDVDGDGNADLSVNDDERHVIRASRDGLVAERLTAGLYTQWPTRFADVDRDQDLDALVMQGNVPTLLRNDGALPWVEVPIPALQLAGQALGFAELHPGTPGAALLSSTAGKLQVAANLGGGTFGAWTPTLVESAVDLETTDVDGDGDLDVLAIAGDYVATATFLENTDGQGTFAERIRSIERRPRRGQGRGSLAIGDLDGDGLKDIAANFALEPSLIGVRRGVIQVDVFRAPPRTLEGSDFAVAVELTTGALADYEGNVRLTAVDLLAGLEGVPTASLVQRLEVYVESDADGVWTEADTRVGVVEAPAEALTRVPLDDSPLLEVGSARAPKLYALAHLAPGAHLHSDQLYVGWSAATATYAGEPVPVAGRLPLSVRWALRNQAPVAEPDVLLADEGAATQLDLLANDSDPRDDPLQIEVLSQPVAGVLEPGPEGSLVYTHDGSEAPLEDGFTYQALDAGGARSAEVAVTLSITPINDPPVGQPEAYATPEDTPLVVESDLGVLLNDTDVDSALLGAVLVTPPEHGALELFADGGFIYTPEDDYAGPDAFTYRPEDGEIQGEAVRVDLEVGARNDPPRPAEGAMSTAVDTRTRLRLSAGDPEMEEPWLLIETFPDRGHLVDLDPATAEVTYVPPRGFVGQARFSYRLSDGRAVSAPYEAVIEVSAP